MNFKMHTSEKMYAFLMQKTFQHVYGWKLMCYAFYNYQKNPIKSTGRRVILKDN
jgi:hypothetical protein